MKVFPVGGNVTLARVNLPSFGRTKNNMTVTAIRRALLKSCDEDVCLIVTGHVNSQAVAMLKGFTQREKS